MKPKFYTKLLNRQPNMKAQFFWNMMGTGVSSVASVIVLMAVTRISGEVEAGIFSIGFAIAQLMWSIGSFDTMTYQITDVRERFSFGDYHAFKLILCVVMMLVSWIYIFFFQPEFTTYKIEIAMALCFFRAIDAFSNLFMSALQKKNRLDLGGMSFFIRVVLSYGILIGCLAVTKNLLLSIWIGSAINILWVLMIEMPVTAVFEKLKPVFRPKKLKDLFAACFPLFLGLFILNYIFNAPKYALDRYYTDNIQTYYNIILFPASIINLLCIFIFKPLLTSLAHLWNEKNKKKFVGVTLKLIALVTVFSVILILAGYFLGTPLLSMFYGVNVRPYTNALTVILVGGGLYALVSFIGNILVVMRKQSFLLAGYCIAAVSAYFISPPLVRQYEIMGAAFAYALPLLITFLFLMAVYIYCLKDFGRFEKGVN